ncbi:hypothetical protein RUM44_010730 [Polyplax serrata]|uniref:Uncharacterized protein n=1 Tax=Polyplax serrata TaxID=468196 RepID=A0ABR1AN18_POLSC
MTVTVFGTPVRVICRRCKSAKSAYLDGIVPERKIRSDAPAVRHIEIRSMCCPNLTVSSKWLADPTLLESLLLSTMIHSILRKYLNQTEVDSG